MFSATDACHALARLAHAHASTSNLDFPASSVRLVHDLFRRFQPYAAMPGPGAETRQLPRVELFESVVAE